MSKDSSIHKLEPNNVVKFDNASDYANRALADFAAKAHPKYLRGVLDHGQGLPDCSLDVLLDEIENEIIDLVFYLYELRQRGLKDE